MGVSKQMQTTQNGSIDAHDSYKLAKLLATGNWLVLRYIHVVYYVRTKTQQVVIGKKLTMWCDP